MADDFSGIWRCTYWYQSDRRGPGEYESSHQMVAQRRGNRVIFESLPSEESFLLVQLRIDDRVASGSWEETATEKGPFKGARFYGPVQLVLDKDGKAFRGMYLTVGKNMYTKANKFEIIHQAQAPEHIEGA